MARYTTQTVIAFDSQKEYRALVPDSGASVAVEFWSGIAWTADAKSPLTSPDKVFAQNVRARFTPTGGGFYIDEEAAL